MVTIKMIAERCGVSNSTVSKALNGAPDIGAETAGRIRRTAAEMGYIPNAAARALKTSRSRILGVLYEDTSSSGLSHEYFSVLLDSFKERAQELAYDGFIFVGNRLGGRPVSYLEYARSRNCDGVALVLARNPHQVAAELMGGGIPMVAVDYVFDNCGSVLSDNARGMRDLVTYIHSRGHRRIAFVYGHDIPVTRIRIDSFYSACAALGMEVPGDYVVPALYHDPDSSEAAARKLLTLPDPPSCIIFPDDFSYIGGMNAIERMGLTIPGDVSAAGYDGIYLGQVLRPRLTTLKQDAPAIGRHAAEELVRAVEEEGSYLPRRIVVPGELLPGGTVAAVSQAYPPKGNTINQSS